MPALSLITLDQAKAELRIVGTDEDDQIELYAIQATATVIDYLKKRADPLWTLDTVPPPVQAAILILLVQRYARDPATDADTWDAVDRLLVRFRDPALA